VARFPFLALLLCSSVQAWAAALTATEIARSVREAGLDPNECYRVRGFSFAKEDVRIYLNEGYLIFGRPVLGQRQWAIFSGDVEGGDGEIILIPPTRSERQSLAKFTQSPTLDEHLRSALMIFTDGTADEMLARLQREDTGRKAPEAAPLLIAQWAPVVSNIAGPMEVRLVQDLLAPRTAGNGLVFLAVSGKKLGNFDVILDAYANRRIAVRQRSERDGGPFVDVWTSFPSRSARNLSGPRAEPDFTLSRYRIEAAIAADMRVKARTHANVKIGRAATRVLPLDITQSMRLTSVKIDGQPAELLIGDSPRARIAARGAETTFLVVAPEDLPANSEHEVEMEHEGDVIATAGDGVYFVNARGSWYPHGVGTATYDLTFRYPKRLTLVTAGDVVEDKLDGDWRVTHRHIGTPISAAGFNLGDYEKVSGSAAGIAVDVYGNRHLAEALRPRVVYVRPLVASVPSGGRRGSPPIATEPIPVLQPVPDPLGRLKDIVADLTSSLEFFSGIFGPPAMKTLTVAPIPGTFGQGFPGLVYLSTFAYIEATQRPAVLRNARERVFFSELIVAHEAAHQWWGAVVSVDRTEDEWLIESLANYSSLMWLEKKKGVKEMARVLDNYRAELLAKEGDLESRESSGPVVWGERLRASGSLEAWRTVVYGKGAWIMHMLRRRMGEGRFIAMLAQLRVRFTGRPITTEDFRALAVEFRPKGLPAEAIENFFDSWVYATGVPGVKMRSSTKGSPPAVRLSGVVEQEGVEEEFSIDVPVEVQFGRGTPQIIWVRTSNGSASFATTLRQAPSRVLLSDDTLIRK